MSDDKISNHSATMYGYRVEWRIKPDKLAVKGLLPFDGPSERWQDGPYRIDQLGRLSDQAQALIRPCIHKYDDDLARYGLIRRSVAEAVLACLKTQLEKRLLEVVEWRIARCKLEAVHTITRDDDDKATEDRQNDVKELLAKATGK